ncbi:hypothetical protein AMTR_s00002p00226230 [Amborella trichopoda]|uniref:Uncharacterized protein n=1 Tax=Amborella trichopoda TaxID=13333 RepID=W1NZT9_AMBTC|nr:hypothetical protein AMTR_s00002p00226230 [Amborella trichopoda]
MRLAFLMSRHYVRCHVDRSCDPFSGRILLQVDPTKRWLFSCRIRRQLRVGHAWAWAPCLLYVHDDAMNDAMPMPVTSHLQEFMRCPSLRVCTLLSHKR